jgi:hypothetical protein
MFIETYYDNRAMVPGIARRISLLLMLVSLVGCVTEISLHKHLNSLGLLPGNKPDDNPDYQNDQKYSHPDSSLEDISDHLTASQGHSRKKQNYEEVRGIFHRHPPLGLVRFCLYFCKVHAGQIGFPDYRIHDTTGLSFLCSHGRKLSEVMMPS